MSPAQRRSLAWIGDELGDLANARDARPPGRREELTRTVHREAMLESGKAQRRNAIVNAILERTDPPPPSAPNFGVPAYVDAYRETATRPAPETTTRPAPDTATRPAPETRDRPKQRDCPATIFGRWEDDGGK